MTDREHLIDAAPFVLGALSDLEQQRYERHLEECAKCRAEVEKLMLGLDDMAVRDATTPPARIRSAVLGRLEDVPQVGPVGRRSSPAIGIAAAALLALIVAVGAIAFRSVPSIEQLLARPDTTVAALPATDAYDGAASTDAVVSGDGSIIYVRIDDLEPAPAGATYEAWLIGPSGDPKPAGLFTPGDDGSVVFRLDGARSDGALIGVTIEPAGGSPQPTGDVLFLGEA